MSEEKKVAKTKAEKEEAKAKAEVKAKAKADKKEADAKAKADKKEADAKAEKDKPKVHKVDGRKIGKTTIDKVEKVEINGREYNDIYTVDGLIFRLNDKDFKLQVSK